MLHGLNYSKVLETVFSRGFVAQQQAGKFIPENFFARANCQAASPDVTSQRLIYASAGLHLTCLTCFGFGKESTEVDLRW